MKYLLFVLALMVGSAPTSAQEVFQVGFDHVTVLVSDLERSAAFYENVPGLQPLESPFGPETPILFYSMGGRGELHVALMDDRPEPDKRLDVALAVHDYDAFLRFLGAYDST